MMWEKDREREKEMNRVQCFTPDHLHIVGSIVNDASSVANFKYYEYYDWFYL